MSTGTLYYFPVHGRAGSIRMMLAHAEVSFEDVMYTKEQWTDHKNSMPNGQMPAW